ncbi:hypothetical protein Q1695_005611 [Nippostrongylus brasiliensis]|nr:hypothetical protein Q1695_005611 [Nippostrongylus brasiliensis]
MPIKDDSQAGLYKVTNDWDALEQTPATSGQSPNNRTGRGGSTVYYTSTNRRVYRTQPPMVQIAQRQYNNSNLSYQTYNRPQSYTATTTADGRLQYTSAPSLRGRFLVVRGGQRGQIQPTFPYNQLTQNVPDYPLITPYNGDCPGNVLTAPKRTPTDQKTTMADDTEMMALTPETTFRHVLRSMNFTIEGRRGTVHVEPTAVMIDGICRRHLDDVLIYKNCISFAIIDEQDADDVIGVAITENCIETIIYTSGTKGKRYCHLFFYFELNSANANMLRTKLRQFFGAKVNCVESADWKFVPKLVHSIRDIVKYAQSLNKSCYQNENSNNDGVITAQAQPPTIGSDGSMVPVPTIIPNQSGSHLQNKDCAMYLPPDQLGQGDVTFNRFPKAQIMDMNKAGFVTTGANCGYGYVDPTSDPSLFLGINNRLQGTPALTPLPVVSTPSVTFQPPLQRPSYNSLGDVSDFPADFLEEEEPKKEVTRMRVLKGPDDADDKDVPENKPKAVLSSTNEALTVEDDIETVKEDCLVFGSIQLNLQQVRENLLEGSLMQGDMASWLFTHYLPVGVLPQGWAEKHKIFFADSVVYTQISSKWWKARSIPAQLATDKAKAFAVRKGNSPLPFLEKIVESAVSVIPIFWENHWVLGIVHLLEPVQKSILGRFIVVDSKFDDKRNTEILKKIAETAHIQIGTAIKAALLLMKKEYELKSFALVRCERLPCQDNAVDCGWYMTLYAERFVKDLSWMNVNDNIIRHMELTPVEEKEFRDRVRGFRKECGCYMERYTQRNLNFVYERGRDATAAKANSL